MLLRLYPERFRAEYGAAMAETYALRAREARAKGRGMWRFQTREAFSMMTAALRERMRGERGGAGDDHQRRRRVMLSSLGRELRHAARRLGRAPGFTLATLLTLGLAIGATTAIYALVNAIVLRPLPYSESDQLVWLDHGAAALDRASGLGMTEMLYVHYRRSARSIESIGMFQASDRNFTGHGAAERVQVTFITPSMATVLRVTPLLGRWFLEAEGDAQASQVAVLSEGFWRSRFGGDRAVLGRTIYLNSQRYEVVGVMPAGFAFPSVMTSIWAPLRVDHDSPRMGGFNYGAIGRLRDDATLDGLRREMEVLIADAPRAFGEEPVFRELLESARIVSNPTYYKDWLVGSIRQTMWVLLSTVGVVLLIACANVGNLFLVRAEGRRREVVLRRALGAGDAQVASTYLMETLLLALVGGVLGAALSWAALRLLVAVSPGAKTLDLFRLSQMLPRLDELSFDWTALGFALACAVFTGLLLGSVSLAAAPGLSDVVRDSGRRSTPGRRRIHARNVMVVAQIAMAFMLLVAGGLMVRSFVRLNRVDPGFMAENLLTFQVMLPGARYTDAASAVTFHETLTERLDGLSGVLRVSASTCIPLAGGCYGDVMMVEGQPIPEGTLPPLISFRRVMPGYFETLGARLVRGRAIDANDHRGRTGAAVISEEMARLYFPGEEAIGKRVFFIRRTQDAKEFPWYTVVGIVRDMPIESLMEDEPLSAMYLPALHADDEGPSVYYMTYVARTAVPPASLVPAIRTALVQLDPDVPLSNAQAMEEIVAASGARLSFTMMLLVTAAVAALTLGTIGIYGVIAYVVSQRSGEIGIRLALGARPCNVTSMVVRHGVWLAGIGVATGVIGALAMTQMLRTLLYDVKPADVATYATVVVLLGGIALFACWLPARRAAGMSPLAALRNE
jgi:predicted permease